MKKSGVYKILNMANDKCYVGSSFHLDRRSKRHVYELRKNNHFNKYLQHAWNKYGEVNFVIIILEYCEVEKLMEREQYYIDTLKPQYNLRPMASSMLGFKHSEETKAGYRLRVVSEENKLKKSLATRGVPKSTEHKLKIAKAHRNFERWPHEKGNKCPCRECMDKRYELEKIARLKHPRKKKPK